MVIIYRAVSSVRYSFLIAFAFLSIFQFLFSEDGKALFERHCVICHGKDGKSQTPTGKALKARDFSKDKFKQGESVEAIAKTIAVGVPGTGMAPFAYIEEADRKKLAEYVLMLKNGKGSASEKVPAKKSVEVTKKAEAEVKGAVKSPKGDNKVSISYAMSKMAEEPRRAFKNISFGDQSLGYKVYAKNCAGCHGNNGEGGITVKFFSAAPYYRVKTEALFGHKGYWTLDKSKFAQLITEGLPGGFMPGNGTLTKVEVQALHDFLKSTVQKAK